MRRSLWLAVVVVGAGFCASGMGVSDARAADPWGRLGHLRVASEPPESWDDLAKTRRSVRIFWDVEDGPARIEAWVGRRWKVLSRAAQSGFQTPSLRIGTPIRARALEADRWSPVIHTPALTPPSALAKLGAPEVGLLAGTVGEIAVVEDQLGAWAATQGGGAAKVGSGFGITNMTVWDGLPDDRVNSVHAEDDLALVGTPAGAALVRGNRVVRVYDDELPDPYVQAVRLSRTEKWFGTLSGLAVERDGMLHEVLSASSVFSLEPAVQGGMWVGYQGLQWVDPFGHGSASIAHDAVSRTERVFGIADSEEAVWLAGRLGGLLHYEHGAAALPAAGYPTVGGFDVALRGSGAWFAAGGLGLVGPEGQYWGAAVGLPSDTVYSVAVDTAGALWVGTDRGVGRAYVDDSGEAPRVPLRVDRTAVSALPADVVGRAMLSRAKGGWLAGPDGVRVVGDPASQAGDLVVAGGAGVTALVDTGAAVWVFGRKAVQLDTEGRLHHIPLPALMSDAVWDGQEVWAVGDDGVFRYDPSLDRFVSVVELPAVARAVSGAGRLWMLSRGAIFSWSDDGLMPHLATSYVNDVAYGDGALWVASRRGIDRLPLSKGQLGDADSMLASVEVSALAWSGQGGCWFATSDGQIGWMSTAGEISMAGTLGADPPGVERLVLHEESGAFVLTERGTWHVSGAARAQ